MRTFFTVDRRDRFTTGQVLELSRLPDAPMPADIRDHLDLLFPNGISDHGQTYFYNGDGLQPNWALELNLEYVRRAFFPRCPSRFVSTFAWRTLDEAEGFRRSASPSARIFEIASHNHFVGNMSLLHNGCSNVRASQLAHCYWAGVEGPMLQGLASPTWEVLLPNPVSVLREVTGSARDTTADGIAPVA